MLLSMLPGLWVFLGGGVAPLNTGVRNDNSVCS